MIVFVNASKNLHYRNYSLVYVSIVLFAFVVVEEDDLSHFVQNHFSENGH